MLSIFVALFLTFVQAENWALLVAGSNTFSNYRHQADIFHTYQILIKNGFDASKIIVMAYDDIATDKSNPFPGQVFNEPDGPDVYIGTDNIDYKGKNVTAKQFYAVLTGDTSTAVGRVLESTSDDNVFVYFDDHGSPGLFCFPTGGYAYADDLFDAITTMHSKKMYKNLLFYVEACYAGSMFYDYDYESLDVYAITAANTSESSWAAYCGLSKYKTCLSNEFSHAWMAYTESVDPKTTTVGTEFDSVKETVTGSHVSEYGKTAIKDQYLIEYQGKANSFVKKMASIMTAVPAAAGKSVPQDRAHLTYLELASTSNSFGDEAVAYQRALVQQKKEGKRASALASYFGVPYPSTNAVVSFPRDKIPLYRRAIETYEAKVERLNDISLWSQTTTIYRAIAEGKLTEQNFGAFADFLATL